MHIYTDAHAHAHLDEDVRAGEVLLLVRQLAREPLVCVCARVGVCMCVCVCVCEVLLLKTPFCFVSCIRNVSQVYPKTRPSLHHSLLTLCPAAY